MPEAAPATPAAPAAAPATPATPAPAANAPWHGFNEADKEAVAYVTNKGWQGPQDVIKSYQGAEKLIGRDPSTLLVMPRADDPAGLLSVLDRLGRPASADKYEFAKPDGMEIDQGYEKFARDAFHKIGLLPGQAKELTAAHNAYVKGVIEQQDKDYNLSVQSDKTALLKEWGGGAERMMAAAKAAANTLGFTAPMVDSLERAIGYGATMKFFSALGQKLGEHKFVGGDGKTPAFDGQMTPAEAKKEWESMKLDPVKVKALGDPSHPSHKELKEKQTTLFKIMYPEG